MGGRRRRLEGGRVYRLRGGREHMLDGTAAAGELTVGRAWIGNIRKPVGGVQKAVGERQFARKPLPLAQRMVYLRDHAVGGVGLRRIDEKVIAEKGTDRDIRCGI